MARKTLENRSNDFMVKNHAKFRKSHQNCEKSKCLFCNGWTWGASQGWKAGYMAARRELGKGEGR